MQTAALLVVLAAIGGVVVVRTVLGEQPRAGKPEPRTQRDHAPAARIEAPPVPLPLPGGPVARPPDRRRRSRRLLTAAALTDALAIQGEEELRPTFFGRTLAFGRLLLVILFICALAGGTLFWMAMMIASRAHIHPG